MKNSLLIILFEKLTKPYRYVHAHMVLIQLINQIIQ